MQVNTCNSCSCVGDSYIEQYTCSNMSDSWKLLNARMSFPSGHSSLSTYAAVYLSVTNSLFLTNTALYRNTCYNNIAEHWIASETMTEVTGWLALAQLSQRDRAAKWLSYAQTWKTGTIGDNTYGHYRYIFNYCDVIGQQSNRIRWKKNAK